MARHDFMLRGISQYISSFSGFEIIHEANNESMFLSRIKEPTMQPQICVIDINTAKASTSEDIAINLKSTFPGIKILAFLPVQSKHLIRNLIRAGVNCLLANDCCHADLKNALNKLVTHATYYPDYILDLIGSVTENKVDLSPVEIRFLKLCCSELTYKEIADRMITTPRAIETLRDGLFKKFAVVSKTGLVLEALRKGIISM